MKFFKVFEMSIKNVKMHNLIKTNLLKWGFQILSWTEVRRWLIVLRNIETEWIVSFSLKILSYFDFFLFKKNSITLLLKKNTNKPHIEEKKSLKVILIVLQKFSCSPAKKTVVLYMLSVNNGKLPFFYPFITLQVLIYRLLTYSGW